MDSDMVMLRDCSSAFSRSAFTDVLLYDDFSHFDWLCSRYNFRCGTYAALINRTYALMARQYRCEYVYKNELISHLLKHFGVKDTVYFSEFRVGNSIADMTMFNGESKAFEIKTEYDSPRRLNKQMADYKRFFDKRYLVVPERKFNDYLSAVDDSTGVIVLSELNGHIALYTEKEAEQNNEFDSMAMISCLRIHEYEDIVGTLGFEVKIIPGYERYKFCSKIFSATPKDELKELFIGAIKKRTNNTQFLKKYPVPIRQMLLSLNLSEKQSTILVQKMKTIINKS